MQRAVLVLVVALVLSGSASAANVATPKMNQVASWAAQKPVSVWCEGDPNAWNRMRQTWGSGRPVAVSGFTYPGQGVVYISPDACANLQDEKSHLFGPLTSRCCTKRRTLADGDDEALAECAARVLIYSALHDFYGVEWFSARMHDVVAVAPSIRSRFPPSIRAAATGSRSRTARRSCGARASYRFC
jgi:hypothetical protein